jgi:esterase/lipase
MTLRRIRQTGLTLGTLLVIAALLSYWILPPTPGRLLPSAYPAVIPAGDSSFSAYVSENRNRIRNVLRAHYFQPDQEPFLGLYNIDAVTEMRAPFELVPASHCEEDDYQPGILMVHGLTDSPYLLRSVANSLKFRFPCALIRALLTPGHGTVPGDLLTVNADDWRDAFDYGVNSFAEASVDEVIALGYSNGSALILDYLNRNPGQQTISKMLLVSPGLQSTNDNAALAPVLRFVWPWLYERRDEDAAKYESFPTRAAGEFYRLTSDVMSQTVSSPDIPALVLTSADDTTTRSDRVLEYYCQWLNTGSSYLYWFSAAQDDSSLPCDNSEVVMVPTDNERFVSYSHVALMIPPGDAHYGETGSYPVCGAYVDNDARYQQCMNDEANTVYGETSLMDAEGLYQGKLVRRSSYNPRFDEMLAIMACFIEPECKPGNP